MLTKMVQKCTKLKKQTTKGREYHDGIFNIFNFHTFETSLSEVILYLCLIWSHIKLQYLSTYQK